ncbi:MAG: transcription elongation factor GreA [Clostridiales bacterium]|nr:MAG: transcription elongation factor GreA [Clostridiales bacterium]
MDKHVYLTKEGLEKLQQDLENMKTVRRKEVAERLKQAIGFGDLSENSEYDDAKNEQAFIEGEIQRMEEMLINVVVIEDGAKVDDGTITIGSKVVIRFVGDDEEEEYKIVGTVEADPMNNRISNESPVGKAIIGHKAGDIVNIEVPTGIVQYEIVKVDHE